MCGMMLLYFFLGTTVPEASAVFFASAREKNCQILVRRWSQSRGEIRTSSLLLPHLRSDLLLLAGHFRAGHAISFLLQIVTGAVSAHSFSCQLRNGKNFYFTSAASFFWLASLALSLWFPRAILTDLDSLLGNVCDPMGEFSVGSCLRGQRMEVWGWESVEGKARKRMNLLK